MPKCDSCGTVDSRVYVGFSNSECPNSACTHYKENLVTEEDPQDCWSSLYNSTKEFVANTPITVTLDPPESSKITLDDDDPNLELKIIKNRSTVQFPSVQEKYASEAWTVSTLSPEDIAAAIKIIIDAPPPPPPTYPVSPRLYQSLVDGLLDKLPEGAKVTQFVHDEVTVEVPEDWDGLDKLLKEEDE